MDEQKWSTCSWLLLQERKLPQTSSQRSGTYAVFEIVAKQSETSDDPKVTWAGT